MPEESSEERILRRKRLQFLCNSKDFEAVRCRLFVSGIDSQTAKKNELIALFAPFGRVYDLALHAGYVFVQYDNIESSLSAIGKLDKSLYKNKPIMVKLAEKGRKAEVAEKETCRFFSQGHCMRGVNCNYQHVNPNQAEPKAVTYPGMSMGVRNGPAPDMNRDRPRREPERSMVSSSNRPPDRVDRFQEKPRERNGLPPPPNREDIRYPDRGSERDRRNAVEPLMAARPAKRPMPDDLHDNARRPRLSAPGPSSYDYPDRPSQAHEPPRALMETPRRAAEPKPAPSVPPSGRREAPPVDLRPPYDCVIITGNEAQRSFCNQIDKRLASFGMLTNIQVVEDERLLKRAVEEASRHTVPYTICVTANNEQHRSLTLNILHGVAQEHRNMPLDDAMPFLSRNFDNFVEMMKQKITAVNEWVAPNKKVAYFMTLLSEGRRLPLNEVLEVDNYIQSVVKKLETPSTVGSGMSGRRDGGEPGVNRGMVDAPIDRGAINRNMGPGMDRGSERDKAQRHGMELGTDRGVNDSSRGIPSRHVPDMGMADRDRRLDHRRESLLQRPQDQDYGLGRVPAQRDHYDRGEARMSTGGLLGGPSSLGKNPTPLLDFESPAVKQALDDLLTARPAAGRENPRGYNLF